MLIRYHWGLGVGHSYSHVPTDDDENQRQTFTATERPVPQAASSPLTQDPSQSRDHVGRSNDPIDSESDEFSFAQRDGEEELESEAELTDSSEEEDDIRTMYMLYDDGVDSD